MKKSIILITLLISIINNAQVGINIKNPHSSAALEIFGTDKGLLPPRIALTSTSDIATIPNPAKGLFIYNTASAGIGTTRVIMDNYYTFDGTKWKLFVDDAIIQNFNIPQLGGYTYVQQREFTIPCTSNTITPLSFNFTDNKEFLNSQIIERVARNNFNFIIKKTGRMIVNGFVFFRNDSSLLANVNDSNNWVTGIRRSTNNGTTWSYQAAQRMPILYGASTYSVAIPFNGVIEVNQGDLIQLAVSNTAGNTPGTCRISYATGTPDSYGFSFQLY